MCLDEAVYLVQVAEVAAVWGQNAPEMKDVEGSYPVTFIYNMYIFMQLPDPRFGHVQITPLNKHTRSCHCNSNPEARIFPEKDS